MTELQRHQLSDKLHERLQSRQRNNKMPSPLRLPGKCRNRQVGPKTKSKEDVLAIRDYGSWQPCYSTIAQSLSNVLQAVKPRVTLVRIGMCGRKRRTWDQGCHP